MFHRFTDWLAAQYDQNAILLGRDDSGRGIWSGRDDGVSDLAYDYLRHRQEIHCMRDLRLAVFQWHRRKGPQVLYRALTEFQEHTRPLYAGRSHKPLAPYKQWLRQARREYLSSLPKPAESDRLGKLLQWRASPCGMGVIMPRSHWEAILQTQRQPGRQKVACV